MTPALVQVNSDGGVRQPVEPDRCRHSDSHFLAPMLRAAGQIFTENNAMPQMDMGSFNSPEPYDQISNELNETPYVQSQLRGFPPQAQVPDQTEFIQDVSLCDAALEFPINWLPSSNDFEVDYSSILEFTTSFAPAKEPTTSHTKDSEHMAFVDYPNAAAVIQRNSLPVTSPSPTVSTDPLELRRLASESTVQRSLYATSTNSARSPCTVRSHQYTVSSLIQNSHPLLPIAEDSTLVDQELRTISFPDLGHLSISPPEEQGIFRLISQSTYDIMYSNFICNCLDSKYFRTHYESIDFPSLDFLNLFVKLYFQHFNSTFPILHLGTLDLNESWLLAVAISAIGCQYSRVQELHACVVPFHEFARRVLHTKLEEQNGCLFDAPTAQALLLNQIGLTYYCGSKKMKGLARNRRGVVSNISTQRTFPRQNHASASIDDVSVAGQMEDNGLSEWADWIVEETSHRLRYASWVRNPASPDLIVSNVLQLLEGMGNYHFSTHTTMSFDLAENPLPHDDLWEAVTYRDWANVKRTADCNPSLTLATKELFQDKHVKPDLGEFARIILLHGVYREISQVAAYMKRPLSTWAPSSQLVVNRSIPRDYKASEEAGKSFYHTDALQVSSWRNAALDCVDTLHWAANATIAAHSGTEHPTVLHLHFARVVLLVPHSDILILVHAVTATGETELDGISPTQTQAIEAERKIIDWAQRDESKARLAALHSGCLFWHIRRYSASAFYEPHSVFLATLSLWAYSHYASRTGTHSGRDRSGSTSRQGSPHNDELSSTEVPRGETNIGPSNKFMAESSPYTSGSEPTFIRLDRPNDDEMVQQFVRSGGPSSMRAHISGVGDIYAAGGSARILREGGKILQTVSQSWGRTRDYIDSLEALERSVTRQAHA
ncbi:hypothetical protein G7046_g195 [Stylonectria norvegica]|nr:hypothetical protein G7046_g195 [Stylonectria norvegica]